MAKKEEQQEEQQNIETTVNLKIPTDYPTVDDLIGTPREFAEELILSSENEQMFYQYGTLPSKTFMINGLPGVGKTFTVQALNNTLNKQVFNGLSGNLPKNLNSKNPYGFKMFFTGYNISTNGTAYINIGSKNVKEFFDMATYMSYIAPVFIEIDECDALLSKRKGAMQTHKEDMKVLETIMKCTQEAHDQPGIYVCFMTNLKEQIDSAMLRAGRIDRHYTFQMPNTKERYNLFDKIIEERISRCDYRVIRHYDLQQLAEYSKGFSHADIAAVVDKSLAEKAREIIKDKKPGIIRAGYVTGSRLLKQLYAHKKEFKTKKEKQRIGYV